MARELFSKTIHDAAQREGIPEGQFARLLQIESGNFDPDVVSGKRKGTSGEIGVAQFMPDTAAALGINPANPVEAINGAARLLRSLRDQFGGDWSKAVAAYNAGSTVVTRSSAERGANWITGIPTSTQKYVQQITNAEPFNPVFYDMGIPTGAPPAGYPTGYEDTGLIPGLTGAANNIGSSLASIANIVALLGQPRTYIVAGAVVLIVGGLIIWVASSPAGTRAIKTAGKVAL